MPVEDEDVVLYTLAEGLRETKGTATTALSRAVETKLAAIKDMLEQASSGRSIIVIELLALREINIFVND